MDNTQEYTCLSLCSGYGGLELGLKRACPNVRTVAYVEVEAFACANLVSKMEAGFLDTAPVWTDIKTFNAEPFRDKIHIITAGYPCQPFSVAGKRKGTDDPRHLWPYIERIIQAVRPLWFFGENVAGHLMLGFPEVYRSLRLMGYSIEAGLFTAAECGAPHKRERLFILAKSRRAAGGNQDGQANGRARQADVSQGNRQTCPIRLGAAGELANPNRSRSTENKQSTKLRASSIEQPSRNKRQTQKGKKPQGFQRDIQKWPARPGQVQYEWEEPRVVGYAPRKRLPKRSRRQMGRHRKPEQELKRPSGTNKNRQAQSRLGGTANGTACRVDRLRLLGNGVVPQQAELAFRTLMGKFEAAGWPEKPVV